MSLKIKPRNQNQSGNSNWKFISQAVNEFMHKFGISSALYMTMPSNSGEIDEIDMLGKVHNINELYRETLNRLTNLLSERAGVQSNEDLEFLRGKLVSVVNNIVVSSWKASGFNYDLAKSLSESSILLIKEAFDDQGIQFEGEAFVDLGEKLDTIVLSSNTLVPFIESVIEISAIRNEEIKSAILGERTPEKLTGDIMKDILGATSHKLKELLSSTGDTKESLGDNRYKILTRQILNTIKQFYGMAMEKELGAMKESGIYDDIYLRTTETAQFYLPIAFSMEHQELVEQVKNEVDLEDKVFSEPVVEQEAERNAIPEGNVDALEKPVEKEAEAPKVEKAEKPKNANPAPSIDFKSKLAAKLGASKPAQSPQEKTVETKPAQETPKSSPVKTKENTEGQAKEVEKKVEQEASVSKPVAKSGTLADILAARKVKSADSSNDNEPQA